MRRADRLFQIIQILRRSRRPITADAIALELETSKRTVYRDIADLMGQRVPIRGEAGIGYVLQVANGNFDLPLMFAGLLVLSTIGVLLFLVVDIAERLMVPWHASQRQVF